MPPIRLLLVDDEPATGAALAGWLRKRGFDVVFADGPAAADAASQAGEFDLVLSDVQMPGNFKLEWIASRLGGECPPPILLMTGSPELETAMRAANLPVAGYLLKPLFYDEAAALIERLAADYRQRRELLALARTVDELASSTAPAANSDPLPPELRRLAGELSLAARRSPRETVAIDHTAPWRDAIADTIQVLEKTKQSFRSKELGELRRRLDRLTRPVAGEKISRNSISVAATATD